MYDESSYDPLTEMFNDQELFSRAQPKLSMAWGCHKFIWFVLALIGGGAIWALVATALWKLS